MFRTRLAGICIAALTSLSSGTLTHIAHAQEVIDLDEEQPAKKGGAKPGTGKKVDIDLDEGQTGASPAAVTAGQMTESAAAAKGLFDKEKWSEAAQALHRVVSGETGDDAGNKQLAEYYLAICLYWL